jgi:septal ring factor EnvC (AmiA/AmiB activator)
MLFRTPAYIYLMTILQNVNKLRDRQAASQTSHDNRRQQLDLHQAEIDELRRALSARAGELEQSVVERERLAAKHTDVARTVAVLEADLTRVKREAAAFGRDLKVLRAEKDRAEEAERKRAEEARRAGVREREAREEVLRVTKKMEQHVCTACVFSSSSIYGYQ